MGGTQIQAFAGAVRDAGDFVTVGSLTCDHNREHLGLHQTAVTLLDPNGRPLLAVDDVPRITDECRLLYFTESWRVVEEIYTRRLVEENLPIGDELVPDDLVMELSRGVGYTGDTVFTLVVPLLEPSGLLGIMVCGATSPFVTELREKLMVVAQHVSVRLAQLGLRCHPDATSIRLTPRQFEVAQLVARGNTNADISSALAMSENTVKKHLKDIFDRLGIASRSELARLLVLRPPREDVPIGVSHRGHLTFTRADTSPLPVRIA